MHAVYHWLAWSWGGDRWGGGNSPGYLIFSGPFADITILTAFLGFYWKHTCHVARCYRVARHPVSGTTFTVCRKHHPDDDPTVQDVHHAARRGVHASEEIGVTTSHDKGNGW